MDLMLLSNLRLFVFCNVKDEHLSEIQEKIIQPFKKRQKIHEQQQ